MLEETKNRESSHWTVVAWIAGPIVIFAMITGGLFSLAWHDVQTQVDMKYPEPAETRFSRIGLEDRMPVLKFEILVSGKPKTEFFLLWQLWPFREILIGAR